MHHTRVFGMAEDMTGMWRSCAVVLREMLWDHRLSVLTHASQRNWSPKWRIFNSPGPSILAEGS